jgi:hypothetical protein
MSVAVGRDEAYKTEATYRRYAIVSETDLREAVAKLSRA